MVEKWIIADLPPEMRPREKMDALGAERLTDGELLAILLRTGSQKESAISLANRILAQPKGLGFLAEASIEDFAAIHGIGLAKASQIKAAVELGRRVALKNKGIRPVIKTPEDVAELLMEQMRHLDREHFISLLLDTKNQVLYQETISVGSLNASIVHPRELFKQAIKKSAAAVILVHNHPSGDPAPSSEDLAITKRLVAAGELLGIIVLDHIIIGDQKHYSLKRQGKM
ncbi:MAG: DNA repair protein RadC [Bacillota bacterium]